jgi:hypothetical protein
MNKKNVAILINGAISKVTGKFDNPGQVYRDGEYINYTAVYNSIVRHIIEPNATMNFDFFMHGWNYDLTENLNLLYKPKKILLEDNRLYEHEIVSKLNRFNANMNRFALCSRSLSIEKVSDIFFEYSEQSGINYDLVVLYRPDILLWKDILLDRYDRNSITVNSMNVMANYRGDFHYILSPELLKYFKLRYKLDSPPNGWAEYSHDSTSNWMYYLRNNFNIQIKMDDIEAGIDQAPVRYINTENYNLSAIKQGYITLEQLYSYGFTEREINSYNVIWGEGVIPQ